MNMKELDFEAEEYQRAKQSTDATELAMLADHPSRYIKARVAGNPYTAPQTLEELRINPGHSGIILWMLGNPALQETQYRLIFNAYVGQAFDFNIHSGLASHKFATLENLERLLEKDRWNITLAVLNNRNRDNIFGYKDLIKALLAPEGTLARDMTEIQKLAYFRYTDIRPW